MHTIIARSLHSLKRNLNNVKVRKKIGLVPTMGCLHEGHLALIKKSKNLNYFTVVTIFVNPLQFNNKSDLKKYPLQEKKDIETLKKNYVDLVFIPKTQQIYPSDFSTYLKEINHSNILCGKYRANHFSGVLTVVFKLFILIQPDYAFFGKKDFQQLFLIKKMVKDLNLEIKIISVNTVRDSNGLALSSRNKLLNTKNQKIASMIYTIFKKIEVKNFTKTRDLILYLRKELKINGLVNIEYLELRKSSNLEKVKTFKKGQGLRVFIAVYLGGIRLIDNFKIN